MKTPTMLYLAYQGWFAANVPLVHELFLPEGLLCVPSERVFCLMMAPFGAERTGSFDLAPTLPETGFLFGDQVDRVLLEVVRISEPLGG